MFKSIGGFFRDIVAPIGIGLTFGPGAAAIYSGISTGIRTGSPLAGLGSAGLSLAASSAFNKLSKGFESSLGFVSDPSKVAPTGGSVFAKGAQGIKSGSINPFTGASLTTTGTGSFAPDIGSVVARTPTMVPQSSLFGGTTNVFNPAGVTPTGDFVSGIVSPEPGVGTFVKSSAIGDLPLFSGPGAEAIGLPSTTVGDLAPDFIAKQSPLMVGGAGLLLKEAATPVPPPAPFAPMQGQSRTIDMSKYGYKGPLGRGDYTYADPEDIAYGRVTPGSYGYLGAKEGGTIKLQSGGVGSGMMQAGPYNPAIEKQKGTFRPTGSMVAPTAAPGISSIAQTQPMMSVSPQKIAGLAQPVAPTIPTTNVPMAQPKAPAPMPIPQPQQQKGGIEEQAQQLINDLPQKDINVNIDQIRQFIGLAEGGKVPTTEKEFARLGVYKRPEDYDTKDMNVGGEVPGMAKQAPAGVTGQSSNIDMSAVNYGKPTPGLRQRFDDEVIGIYENAFGKARLLRPIGRLMGQMMVDQQGDAMFKFAQDNNLLRGIGGSYQGPLQRGPYRYPSSAENLALGKEDVSKIGYENVKYPTPVKTETVYYDQGGEVQSNETLQSNAFVIPADVVGHIGDGSSDAGAQRLQSFLGMNPQQYQAGGIMAGELQGPGGGMDDLIQTSIEGKQAAAVSPQEFVVPRDIVAELGQGSYDKGSNKLYALMRNVRKAKTGTTKQPAELTRGLGQLMRTAVA